MLQDLAQMMYDFRSMKDFDGDELSGLECLGFGALEDGADEGESGGAAGDSGKK